jgi:hypothetical protein
MAIQTRYAGDAYGINNVDSSYTSAGVIVATGLTKNPIAFKITNTSSGANLAAELGTGGAVETILRSVAVDSTLVMYQVEATGAQISLLVEATGSSASAIQTRIQALGGNIGIASNVWANLTAVSSSTGFKLA